MLGRKLQKLKEALEKNFFMLHLREGEREYEREREREKVKEVNKMDIEFKIKKKKKKFLEGPPIQFIESFFLLFPLTIL